MASFFKLFKKRREQQGYYHCQQRLSIGHIISKLMKQDTIIGTTTATPLPEQQLEVNKIKSKHAFKRRFQAKQLYYQTFIRAFLCIKQI
jgi:hypothetical protein